MMQFGVLTAMTLKKMVESISSISTRASIAFSEDQVRISLTDQNTELDALLIICEDFFEEYNCTRTLVIEVDPSRLSCILDFAEDDDQVYVALVKDDDESPPVSLLEIHIYDSRDNEKRVEQLEAPETRGDNLVHEEQYYEFGAGIITSEHFHNAVLYSAEEKQPVTITVTGTSITLASGAECTKLIQQLEKAQLLSLYRRAGTFRVASHYELELSYRHTGTFILASHLSEIVYVIFPTVVCAASPPPSLEFPISQFSKLCFYFPQHSSRNVVLLRVLTAKTLKQMVKSISSISNEALIEFSQNEVAISAENSKAKINALLKINVGFFHELLCRRLLVIRVDLWKLASILSYLLEDDDRVCIFVKDEKLITRLGFHIRDSRNKKNVIAEMEASEVERKETSLDIANEYELSMNPLYFGIIVAQSARLKEPINIIATSTLLQLSTGSRGIILSRKNESECQLDGVPRRSGSESELYLRLSLHSHEEAFITACRIADIVMLREPASPVLEFPIGPFSNLVFNFPGH